MNEFVAGYLLMRSVSTLTIMFTMWAANVVRPRPAHCEKLETLTAEAELPFALPNTCQIRGL